MRTMSASRLWAVLAIGVLVVGLGGCGGTGGTSYNEARYEDPNYAPKIDQDGDVPSKVLGGYTFTTTSDVIDHPYIAVDATSEGIVVEGWGNQVGALGVLDFSYGGLIAGVKTVRMRQTVQLKTPNVLSDSLVWMAQDSAGNVHHLKYKNIVSGLTTVMGVAKGDPACFVMPANPAVGDTWYVYYRGVKEEMHKVLSTNATAQGATNLLQVMWIHDDNFDGTFDESWSGNDDRDDLYFSPRGYLRSRTLTKNPTGGLKKR